MYAVMLQQSTSANHVPRLNKVKIDSPVGVAERFSSKIQQVPRRSMRHIAKHRASNNTEQATTHRLKRDSMGKWVYKAISLRKLVFASVYVK